jgi:adenosylhomocysteine nucleosidase
VETLLVIASDCREYTGLCRRIGSGRNLRWPIDYSHAVERGTRRWILAANGPGPRLAARAFETAVDREKVDAVLSAGWCGALDPALEAGELVAPGRVLDGDFGESFAALAPAEASHLRKGTIVTGDRVIASPEEKRKLRIRTGAAVADMEAASVARAAAICGLPFYCIRVVSDTAAEGFDTDLNRARDRQGRFRLARILAEAARKPLKRIPELIHLHQRTRMASEKLGEFLAGCRF